MAIHYCVREYSPGNSIMSCDGVVVCKLLYLQGGPLWQ